MANEEGKFRIGHAERDLVGLGVAAAAILLFVATGSSVLPSAARAIMGAGAGPDQMLASALLLNIVLIIFGWRRYVDLKNEIGERRRAEELARQLAETDPLTSCLNRRSLAAAGKALCESARAHGQAVALGMIDLDNFKQINDMHGHTVGDRVLVQLTERVRKTLPAHAHLARLGGDEFAFVTRYDPAMRERIDDLVIRLFEAVSFPFECDRLTFDASVSIGVSSDQDKSDFDEATDGIEALMQRADMAMYQAKKQGKNRYFWFEPSMENEQRFRNQIESGIRTGLQRGEFVPYYEQQIDIETGEIVGFEMLARWNSPELGLVSPEIFIGVAEEIGLIAELSDQLMERAFADACEWDENLTLSINISPIQLRDPWFAQKLLKRLVEHKLPARRLEVEITESCLHENIGMVRSIIMSLRNQGVRVSLDDFGTGYSSLEQLKLLPFDRLKIDRSFVGELINPAGNRMIVDAIISLGRSLDIPITVEGIESKELLDALREMGELKGQGYHYGMPEPHERVLERLQQADKLSKRKTPVRVDKDPVSAARVERALDMARKAAQ